MVYGGLQDVRRRKTVTHSFFLAMDPPFTPIMCQGLAMLHTQPQAPHTNSHPTRPNFQSPGHFSLSPVSWKVTGSARPQEKSSCLWRRPTQARTFSFKPGGSPGAVTRDSQLQEPHPGTLAMARGVCAPLQSQALHLSSSSASPPPVKKKSDFHRCLSPD